MRNLLLLLTVVGRLVLVNYSVWQPKTLCASGRSVLLELGPVDPRITDAG